VTPQVLWPAVHEMESVSVAWVAADLCDPSPVVSVTSVTSSEPDDAAGTGDGATTGDIAGVAIGTADPLVELRGERGAVGPGRTYTLEYRATDSSGNDASALGVVTVPHDLGEGPDGLVLRVQELPGGGWRWYWPQWGGAIAYDLVSGDLAAIALRPNQISLGTVEVLARERLDPWLDDPPSRSPGARRCFFYVLEGRTERGGWGYGETILPWPREPDACNGGCP